MQNANDQIFLNYVGLDKGFMITKCSYCKIIFGPSFGISTFKHF